MRERCFSNYRKRRKNHDEPLCDCQHSMRESAPERLEYSVIRVMRLCLRTVLGRSWIKDKGRRLGCSDSEYLSRHSVVLLRARSSYEISLRFFTQDSESSLAMDRRRCGSADHRRPYGSASATARHPDLWILPRDRTSLPGMWGDASGISAASWEISRGVRHASAIHLTHQPHDRMVFNRPLRTFVSSRFHYRGFAGRCSFVVGGFHRLHPSQLALPVDSRRIAGQGRGTSASQP